MEQLNEKAISTQILILSKFGTGTAPAFLGDGNRAIPSDSPLPITEIVVLNDNLTNKKV